MTIINVRNIILLKKMGYQRVGPNETVFVNPPYGNIGEWVKKAYDESYTKWGNCCYVDSSTHRYKILA